MNIFTKNSVKRKLSALLLAALMALSLSACGQGASSDNSIESQAVSNNISGENSSQDTLDKDLVVLYTNDVHSHFDDNIGYAGLNALKKELLADGNYVLLADGGDFAQGTAASVVSKGSHAVNIMDYVDYDVATAGNHEFDYGMDRFKFLVDFANFPVISANFTDLQTGELVLKPYVIKDVGEAQVAFVGISTPNTITSSTPTYFQNENGEFIYGFCGDGSGEKLYSAVQNAVDSAIAEGADYVIGLSHLGIGKDDNPYTSTAVIKNTTGFDVMLDGHSHSVIPSDKVENKDGDTTLLCSTGTALSAIGKLQITTEGKISTELVTEYEKRDEKTTKFINGINAKVDKALGETVAKTNFPLIINDLKTGDRLVRNSETNLGDLCADAFRTAADADIAIVNGGGVRADIGAGDITIKDIINVQPFGNELSLVSATGQEVLDALEFGARLCPEENGGFLQVSGLTYEIDTSIPSSVKVDEQNMFVSVEGDYRVKNVVVGGKPLELDKTYKLASHSYLLQNMGDGYTMFADNEYILDATTSDYTVLLNYVTLILGQKISELYENPYGDGRITIK